MTKRDKLRRELRNKSLEYYLPFPYTIEIIPAEKGGYVARIKELSGCLTQADTWDEVIQMIEEAKAGWLEVALEYDHHIPEPPGVFAKP